MDQGQRGAAFLAQFSVDGERGFLPASDPSTRLPDSHSCWEDLASALPKLLGAGRLREEVVRMPPLTVAGLRSEAERNRAMLLLSYLGHAYIFGSDEVVDVLPATLARPWHEVATLLGRPPVLSYASHALHNWRRFDPAGRIELGNIARLENFLGGVDEDWFVLVHVAIEATAGPGLVAAAGAQDAVEDGDGIVVRESLETMVSTMDSMLAILRRMPENCDPYIYYTRVRPFIFGWYGNPAFPQGIRYEGVAEYGDRPQRFRGETGAQSSIVPAFDTTLGVDYRDDPLGTHLLELRDYMPPVHREFLDVLAKRPSVRDFVLAHRDEASLVAAYDRCIELSAEFRRQHLEYAGTYIGAQQPRSSANPVGVGTGGTPFMKYLAQHVKDMRRYLVARSS